VLAWPGQAPERLSGLIRPRLPVNPDEHRTVAGLQLPGVVLVEIVLSEPLQQGNELLPFASRQAVVHAVHDDQPATLSYGKAGEATSVGENTLI